MGLIYEILNDFQLEIASPLPLIETSRLQVSVAISEEQKNKWEHCIPSLTGTELEWNELGKWFPIGNFHLPPSDYCIDYLSSCNLTAMENSSGGRSVLRRRRAILFLRFAVAIQFRTG